MGENHKTCFHGITSRYTRMKYSGVFLVIFWFSTLSAQEFAITDLSSSRHQMDWINIEKGESDVQSFIVYPDSLTTAPAVIIIHGPHEGSTPVEDAQYAAYNICLMAHAFGLGTCFIGYAVEAMNRVKGLRQYCKIPVEHRVHAVLTVGHPGVRNVRAALRKPCGVTFL